MIFQRESSLKTHIETVHEKRRDHACPYCPGAAFGEKGTLTRHIETVHEKRRDHACPHCPSAFGAKSHLKRHIETVRCTRSAGTTRAPTAPASHSG